MAVATHAGDKPGSTATDKGTDAATKAKDAKPRDPGMHGQGRMERGMGGGGLRMMRGRGGPMPPQMPNGGPPRGLTNTQILATHAAFIGFMGTIAVVTAQVFHIDLFGMFQWGDTADYRLALELLIPLQVLNVALLLPDWSSWELPPPPELSQEQQAAAAAALTATAAATAAATSAPAGQNAGSTGGMGTGDAGSEEWTLLRSAPLGPPPGLPKDAVAVEVGQEEVVGPSSHASPSTASAAEPSRRSPSPSPQTTISQPSSVPPEGRGPASSSSGRSSTPGSSGSSAASPPPGRLPSPPLDGKLKLVEAKAWGTAPAAPAAKQQPAFFPSMQTFRDAAHLAQGHYVANNPTANMQPVPEAGVALLHSLASELMFRGVIVGGLALLIRAAAYHQGTDDFLALPPAIAQLLGPQVMIDGAAALEAAAHGLQMVSLDDVSRYLAGLGVVVVVGVLAGRRVQRSRRKTARVGDITRRIQAVAQKVVAKANAKKAGGADGGSSTGSMGSTDARSGSGAGSGLESGSGLKGGSEVEAELLAAISDALSNTPSTPHDHTAAAVSGSTASRASSSTHAAAAEGSAPAADSATTDAKVSSSDMPGAASSQAPPTPAAGSNPARSDAAAGPKGMAGSSLPAGPPEAKAGQGVKDKEKSNGLKDVEVKVEVEVHTVQAVPGGGPFVFKTGPGQLDAVTWATTLQSVRDMLQTVTLTSIFVVSGGNLAASFFASTLNQLVFSLLQRTAQERARERGAKLAAEMEEVEAKLRSLVKKREEQIRVHGGKVPPEGMHDGSSSGSSSSRGSGEAAASLDAATTSQSATNSSSNGHAAAAAAAVSAAADKDGAPAAPAAVSPSDEAATQGPAAHAPKIQRTLSALDALLPPEAPKKK